MPEKLAELSLSRIIQGQEATAVVNRMHGKQLEASEDVIGYYGKFHARNILYVSAFETAEKAKANLMKMATKMARGTKVFAPPTYDRMGDQVGFKTSGMGFVHYFYRVDNVLIWWQVESEKARSTYQALRAFDFSVLKAKARHTQ